MESGDTTLLATDSYSWDAVGNPDAAGDSVEVGNRLVELGSISLSYDADGNIISRTGGGETVDYWWNSLSELDSAERSIHGKVRYRYDGFGRRVYMNDAIATTHFLWEGDDVVADIDASGNATRFYNYYPGVSKLHSLRIDTSGYLYLKDGSGNVVGLQDDSGTLVNQYTYSPFGDSVSVSESVANRFRFASGEQDRLGLYYFRARYYEPALRRFLSEDPIGLAGGINPYVYAANNPIDLTDRSGLCPEDESETEDVPCIIDGITVTVDKEPDKDDGSGDSWEPGERQPSGSGEPVSGGSKLKAAMTLLSNPDLAVMAVLAWMSTFDASISATYGLASGTMSLDNGKVVMNWSIPGYGFSFDRTIPWRPAAGPRAGSVWFGLGPNFGVAANYTRGSAGVM